MIKRLLNRFVALFFSSLISIQCFAYEPFDGANEVLDNIHYQCVDGHARAYVTLGATGDIKLRDKVKFKRTFWENGEEKVEYKEFDVTEVGNPIDKNKKITSITANGIITVAANAFKGCTSLKRVMLGNTLVKIGDGAFRGCTALKKSISLED